MRVYLFLMLFLILVTDAYASWQTNQNDLRNTGSANGTGYFPLETSNYSIDGVGMDFQPLVDDLNADGKNEIVIFSNSSLIVFNPTLAILNQAKIGPILGQPTLFDFDDDRLVEIIFNARQNSSDYFFAYQFNNSNLKQEFNITLPNESNFSGIKCFKANNSYCTFKDKLNYIHIVDMTSRTDNSYNTSIYGERRHTVPAIGDIDNDGNLEAVWWFNDDNASGYGFLAFDLSNRAVKWKADNIFSPLVLIPGIDFFELFKLKGQPLLVDLNNDNKLEIAASVFYDDSMSGSGVSDWFTELFVYSSNGTKLFSKCEVNTVAPSVRCNDGDSQVNKWEGTNPFVLDYDKNGLDDVCFAKDVKKFIGIVGFDYMALNCYNYSGDEIAKVNLSSSEDGIKGTAMVADMDNDNNKEIIISHGIYKLDGTKLFSMPSLSDVHPIAVDIDGNKGLDLVWTFGNQTKVFLDNANYSIDLSVDAFDVIFSGFNTSHVNVTSIIKNTGQVEVSNIKTIMYNTETLENKTALINIKKSGNFTFSALLGLKENQKVLVSVDFDNELNESNEDNNAAIKEFVDLPHVFVSLDNLEPFNVQSEFRSFIKNKLISGYYTENENEADVKVYIGKKNPINIVNNIKTLEEFEFGYDFGNIIYYDKVGINPYAGLVGAFKDTDGKVKVMIVGNEIEGDIIGVKEFIKNQALLLNTITSDSIFADDENADAIKVYDYLHLGGNSEHYNVNNN